MEGNEIMNQYPKINGLYKRYLEGAKKGKFIIGEYSKPEFEFLKDLQWVWTEKIDGTNIRVCYYTCPLCYPEIEFKGKTDKADVPKHLLEKLQQLFPLEKMKEIFGMGDELPDVCLYGEGYGYKIQTGGKYVNGEKRVEFILFDIKIGNYWLKREDLEKIADQLGIGIVPIIGETTIDCAISSIKKGVYSTFGDFIAEGVVGKLKYELRDRRGYRIITKIKTKDFKGEIK